MSDSEWRASIILNAVVLLVLAACVIAGFEYPESLLGLVLLGFALVIPLLAFWGK